LVIVGLAHPENSEIASYDELARKARVGEPIYIKEVKRLTKKNPFVTISHKAGLAKAMELFSSGVHRVGVVDEESHKIVGILSQLRALKFFWENGGAFPEIDQLFQHTIKDLNIGSSAVINIK
jgi:CBS-domain-containing membrane protein